jgi:hypothetical protein
MPGLDLRISEVPYTFRARVHGESKLGARVALDFAALLVSRLAFGVLPQRFSIVGISGIAVHFLALLGLIHTEIAFTIVHRRPRSFPSRVISGSTTSSSTAIRHCMGSPPSKDSRSMR